ncbi:MAG: hypothetical protein ACRDJN_32535 [Chloroflexota bacterium]
MNRPQPIVVESDATGRPRAVTLRAGRPGARRLRVLRIEDTWQIEEGWWQERPVSRRYWRLALADGRTATVFQDLLEGTWWRQNY